MPTPRLLPLLITLCALAACGGGGSDTEAQSEGTPSKSRTRVAAVGGSASAPFFPSDLSIPQDAHQKGAWSRVYAWPHVAVHAVLMPDGRVMTYGSQPGGNPSGRFQYDIWEGSGAPDTGHSTLPNTVATEIFCSTQIVLPGTNDVFIGGGDVWAGNSVQFIGNATTTLFSGSTNSVSQLADMKRPRWYATSTTLTNGEIFIQGGLGGIDHPEIRGVDGSFRLLDTIDTSAYNFWYPANYVASDGRIFGYDALGQMYYLNPRTLEHTRVGQLPNANTGTDTSSAMFRPGRVLHIGGNSNGALVIDFSAGAAPVVTPTQSLSSQRRLVNATLLADGQVLATGGSEVWNTLTGVNNAAEIWNPATGQWTVGHEGTLARLYHSGALLMPDASVLVVGGGADSPTSSLPLNNTNVEVYYPPYLFAAGGQLAARPTIASAPMAIEIGKTFPVQVGAQDQISRVSLVKTGSTTHARNMDQRFLELTFTTGSNGQLTVQAPARAGDATPGTYMLFVLNDQGVPSVASMVSIGVAADPNPLVVPELQQPANQSDVVGTPTSLTLSGTDPNGDTLTYSASGLPAGLSLDAATGVISGTPSTAGSFNVTASVTDGANVATANFTWTVANANALFLSDLGNPQPVSTSGTASFTATVTGGLNPSYRWNFGDGSALTAWSSQASVTHTYTSPGTYTVTFFARDERGELISRSFLQTVYLPATAQRPAASSQMLLESGGERLWVVNPDNDSVSAFDVATRARLAEVSVGNGPRSLAQAADGSLWVVNKDDATISVIDPTTRSLTATVALPRASQPHGLVISPSGQLAYVTLEATGQLLRIDTASRAVTGTLAVGARPRHLSITGNGSQLFVSRFISPLLPGETGTQVAPTLSTGGEVLRINAATLQIDKTIVLRVSDVPDGQNSGRGLPNYLGAPVISPDGSQAWVAHKVDNVQRGVQRDGQPMNFQNTVRAAASRINLATGAEDYTRRLDLDNASMAGAAAYDPLGVYLFVALETSREVVVMNAHQGRELMRFDVGRTPQGLLVSPDGLTLYVHNFMDRSLGIYDLRPLVQQGLASVPRISTLTTITNDLLTPQVLLGKQLFHDARDPRLSRDNYMSCASCHDEGGHDGRVWDFTNVGEGLRNTISLRGRGGAQGRLHWSANFDEVQDFEMQIRNLAGGLGLMSDAQLQTGTRTDPLGDAKAGVSADLDALAAYVGSLKTFDASPFRAADGTLTTEAVTGRGVFAAQCASCHAGTSFTDSATNILRNVGTHKTTSGLRLGARLNGIDTPTLRDAWATAPYLHDGSATTLEAAITGHASLSLTPAELAAVAAFTRQIGREETAAPSSTANLVVRAGGASAGHIGPLMSVRVGGQVIAQAQIDSVGQDYTFNTPFLTANTPIDLVFTNDERIGTEDRSLAVGLVRINQSATIRTVEPGVTLDLGSGDAAFDGLNTVAGPDSNGLLTANGAFRYTVPSDMTPPGGGTDTITLRAKANLAGGIGANVVLRVNGVVVGTQTVDSITEQNYVFTGPTLKGGDKVDVVFTNDAAIGGENRDLYVRSVKTSLYTLLPSDEGAIIDKGEGNAAFDGLDLEEGDVYGGWVAWSGALRLNVPVSPPLVLRARASLAGGQGANVEVRRNGSLLGTLTVDSTVLQDYPFPDVVLLPGDKIDVVFTNDALLNGEDRNFYVSTLTSGTLVMRPGDAGNYIDKGEGAAAFDGLDLESATVYGGWVPWNAAMRLLVPDPSSVPTPDTVVVRAASVQAGGLGAQIALRVNGVTFSTKTVDSAAVQAYSFPSPTIAPGDKLDIVYLNDEVVNGIDRNLFVESVTAGGQTLRPSDSTAVIDVGDGQAAFDGLDTRPASIYGGWVPWSGAMRWTLASAPVVPRTDTVTIRARASLAAGVGARVELRLNGEVIDSVMVDSTTDADYPIATPPVAAGDKVDVAFTNDAVINNEDRNLRIATVTVRGVALTPADGPLDVGSGQAAYDGVEVLAGNIYGGVIPWNAALRLTAP